MTTPVGPLTESIIPDACQEGTRFAADEGPDVPQYEPEPIIWHSSLSPWSQSEVDAFFHALSVHSRWRPDLIADAVKSKGEVEVVEFLMILDSCARSREAETNQDIRETVPAATEVSDKWVAVEEAMAAAIVVQEDRAEHQELEAPRRKRVRDTSINTIPEEKRRRITNRVGEHGSMDHETEWEDEDDVSAINVENARFEKLRTHEVAAGNRDNLLRKLEDTHLQVLDTILREDEEAQKERNLTCKPANVSVPDAGVDLNALSPLSRRRITKRLYMRRMRARLRGEDLGKVGEIAAGLERMKPGRKGGKKKEQESSVVEETSKNSSERGAASESVEPVPYPSDGDDVEDADGKTRERTTNVSGKTRCRKIRVEFENAGIDASYLHKRGMGLFRYVPFGNLVGIFKSLMSCPEEDTSASYISADLMRHLQASVVAFISDVVHRAIVWKEQDNELKGQKKVWRGALDQINVAAIEHALKAIGVRAANKQEYFTKLLDHYDLSLNEEVHKEEPTSPMAADTEDEQLSSAGHIPDIQGKQQSGLSPHRTLYTPAFLVPAAFNICVVDTFFPGYDACFPTNACFKEHSCEEAGDPLLSDETDDEALERELQEDDILDQADVETSKRFEEQLWVEVGKGYGEGVGVASG